MDGRTQVRHVLLQRLHLLRPDRGAARQRGCGAGENYAVSVQKLGQRQPFIGTPTGMRGSTCTFWVNLTPLSMQEDCDVMMGPGWQAIYEEAVQRLLAAV